MQMRTLSTRTMTNDVAKHKNNDKLRSKHNNNANEAAKHKNDAK